ncbi:hypothetical protein F5Y17DRAFT_439280 [Xylariaceae sp. FL0594]|nr:hypothetical protein F5Y17DRAFT_439280 [Xylariaceae sp. FL0594]
MAETLSPNRVSFSNHEDDTFAEAYSAQPASRFLNRLASNGPTEVSDEINSAARPSEPLASVHNALRHACQGNEPAVDCASSAQSTPSHQHHGLASPRCNLLSAAARDNASESNSLRRDAEVAEKTQHNTREESYPSPAPAVTTSGQAATSLCLCRGCPSAKLSAQPSADASGSRMDSVMADIRAFLSRRKHGNCTSGPPIAVHSEEDVSLHSALRSSLPPANPYQGSSAGDWYLLNTSDIAHLLDTAVAGLSDIRRVGSRSQYQALLSPGSKQRKPSLHASKILPGSSSPAVPATTICSPRPYFASSGFAGVSKTPYTRPESAYIPRQALPEMSWDTAQPFHDETANATGGRPGLFLSKSQNPSRHQSACCSKARQHSWPQQLEVAPKTKSQRVSFELSPCREIPNPLWRRSRRLSQRSTSEPLLGHSSEHLARRLPGPVSMTSFPKLRSRSCTNDWLTPLGLTDELEDDYLEPRRRTVADLYCHGVDAHVGTPASGQQPDPKESAQLAYSTPTSETRSSSSLSSRLPFSGYESRWPCNSNLEMPHKDRLGRSIGSASHKRISFRSAEAEEKERDRNTVINRLRRYSLAPSSGQASKSVYKAGDASAATVPVPQGGRKDENEDRRPNRGLLQNILDWADPPDDRLKSSTSLMSAGGRGACSEETAPHVCMDELSSPWSEQSIRWSEGRD